MKLLAGLILLASLNISHANADSLGAPYEKADALAGKALVDAHCINCHAASFGGDGASIYTREYHKVKTAKGLVAQVRNCNTMVGLQWFEDDELNVAKYLNDTYYKFSE